MAHELSNVSGQYEAAFVVNGKLQPPWHGLGTYLDSHMTPHDALREAHMEWEVDTIPMQYAFNGEIMPVYDKRAVIRMDTGLQLGVVGNSYVAMQNREQADFIEALVGEGLGCVECVGALFSGKKTFWTIRVPGNMVVGGSDSKDFVEKYLIVSNSNDSSMTFRAFWSPIRVVCNNTLKAALHRRSVQDSVSIYHTTNMKTKIDEARKILNLASAYYREINDVYNQMRDTLVHDGMIRQFLDAVFPKPEDPKNTRAETICARNRQEVMTLFQDRSVPGVTMSGRTVWGLYNSITHRTSHMGNDYVKSDAPQDKASARMNSLMFGGTREKLNQTAFDSCLALMGAN